MKSFECFTQCQFSRCDSRQRYLKGFHPPRNPTVLTRPHRLLRSSRLDLSPSTIPIDDASLSPEVNILIFIIGLVPFLWATVEFWRRIAFGEAFGTGKDSVIIGEDMKPSSSRGRRTLGRGALVTAYVLFGIAVVSVAFTVYSVLSTGF